MADRVDEGVFPLLALAALLHLPQQLLLELFRAAVAGVDERHGRAGRQQQQGQRHEGYLVVAGAQQRLVERQPVQFVRGLHLAYRLGLFEAHGRIADLHGEVVGRAGFFVAVQGVEHPGAFLVAGRGAHALYRAVFGEVDQRIGAGERADVFAAVDGFAIGGLEVAGAGHGQPAFADRFEESAGQEEVHAGFAAEGGIAVLGKPRLRRNSARKRRQSQYGQRRQSDDGSDTVRRHGFRGIVKMKRAPPV